jgi:hypothetical protein
MTALQTTQTDETAAHHAFSERKGAALFADQWSNAKCAKVAYLAGQGWTAQATADRLQDGTTARQITAMTSHWGIATKGTRHTYAPLPIELSGRHRGMLAAEALRRGIPLPVLGEKLLATVAADDLFGAVLDS